MFCRCIAIAIISLLFIFQSTDSTAQSAEGKTIYTTDSTKILQFIDKGNTLIKDKPDEALVYFLNAYRSSVSMHYAKGQVLASIKLGTLYFGKNVNRAVELVHEALKVMEAQSVGTLQDKLEGQMILAESYNEKGQQDSSAYYYYLLSNEIENNNLQDPAFAIDFYTKLTVFWLNLNYDAGVEYWNTIRSYVEKANDAASQMKESADALSSVLFLQGAYYHGRKQFDSARYYYISYIRQREKINLLPLVRKISTLANIADTYLKEEKPLGALKYIQEIEKIGNESGKQESLTFFITFVNLMKAQALFQLKDYNSAITLTEQSLKKLETTGDHLREETVNANKFLADAYEAIGNYEQALKYKNIFINLSAQLNNTEKVDIVKRQEVRYRMAANDKKLVEQQLVITENKAAIKQRNIIIISVLLLLVLASAFFITWRRKNVQKQKLQQASIDNLQRSVEIERLYAAMVGEERERNRIARELHDGVGGLLSAAKMNLEFTSKNVQDSAKDDVQTSVQLIQDAASELRKVAHNMMPALLLEEGLPNAVKLFCESVGNKGQTKFICQILGEPQKLNPTFELHVYRIVQELVHNIIKHAKAKNALVQMSFSDDGGLNITVEDNGKGMEYNADIKGMGLKSISDRVKALNGRIDIESMEGSGTSIYIELEQNQHNYQPA